MKKTKLLLMFLISIFGGFNIVNASSDDFTLVADEASFDECIQNEGACRLSNDLEVSARKEIMGSVIIDLNGHVIEPDENLHASTGLIIVNRGAKLIVNDSVGTGKITTGTSGNVWGGIQLNKNNTSNELAELIVNAGSIEGYYYGVVGNGTLHNTKITINNGTIKGLNTEDSVGIYHPQEGELIVNGGDISGGTGIEIRSGSLTVNNGSITGVASTFLKAVNGNGSTTNGVGITVAQHTTKKPINVSIHNGNIKGQYAFYEWNPHRNNPTALNQISINIYGGNFEGTADGASTIYSEDFTGFVSGGSFNKNVDRYLKEGATVFKPEEPQKESKSSSKWPLIIIIIAIPITGIIGLILWKKGKLPF